MNSVATPGTFSRFEPRTLGIVPLIPAYLALLLSLGRKYVPHRDNARTGGGVIKRQLHDVSENAKNLTRVLIWSTFFSMPEQDHLKEHNLYLTLPYDCLHTPKGTNPPQEIIDRIGPAYPAIVNSVTNLKYRCFESLSEVNSWDIGSRGISWRPGLLSSFLEENVVVSSDKDGSQVVMPVSTYQLEVRNHMAEVHPCGQPTYERLGDSSPENTQLWQTRAQGWGAELRKLVVDSSPDLLKPTLITLHDNLSNILWPQFYLLAKTHKPDFKIDKNGHWPSRPVVGLHSWFTTPASRVMSVLGQIFGRLDRFEHPSVTYVKDTLDLVERLHDLTEDPPPP